MLHRFRERFGTAGLVVAVFALVLALTGGAFAASGGLNAKQKKEVKKIAKGFQGTGPAGAAGTNGTNGTNGKDGASGKDGLDGEDGTDGTSVTSTEFGPTEEPPSEPCAVEPNVGRGGSEFESASPGPTYACNGEEGSPWTAGGTLPPGATETGEWAVATPEGFSISGEEYVITSMSFTISLPESVPAANVHYIGAGEPVPGVCDDGEGEPGSSENPEAEAGHLCVFNAVFLVGASEPPAIGKNVGELGAEKTGAVLIFLNPEPGGVIGSGSFAVTAPEP